MYFLGTWSWWQQGEIEGNGQKQFLLLPFLVLKSQLFNNQRENRVPKQVGLKPLNYSQYADGESNKIVLDKN